MERVRGPLFEPSTGYFVLLPALAFAAQEVLDRRIPRILGLVIVFSLAVTILGLGSRAGLLILGAFVLMSMLMMKRRANTLLLLVVLALCGTGAWMVVFSRATTTRLEGLNPNEGRLIMHQTGWTMIRERPVVENITGSGYGAWWPWYVTEADLGSADIYSSGRYTRVTPYGLLLYHPHSTVLMLVIELGLPGAFFVWKLGRVLAGAAFSCARENKYPVFASGIAVATLSLFFDLFLFRRPTRDTLWWVFLFGLLALVPRKDENARASELLPDACLDCDPVFQ